MICKNSCTPSPTCELFLVIHRTIVVSWHSLWRIFDFQQNQTPIKFCRAMIHLFGFAGTRGAPLLSLSVIGLRKLDCCFASRGFLILSLETEAGVKEVKKLAWVPCAVAPIRYAHLAAAQMSQFVKFDETSESASSHGGVTSAGEVPVLDLPRLHWRVENSMFFC